MPRSESMKNSGEPKERTNGRTMGTAIAEGDPGKDRADQGTHQHRPERSAGLAVARHGMAVDDGRSGGRLSRHAE